MLILEDRVCQIAEIASTQLPVDRRLHYLPGWSLRKSDFDSYSPLYRRLCELSAYYQQGPSKSTDVEGSKTAHG